MAVIPAEMPVYLGLRDMRCGPGQVIVGLAAAAVLEDLDPDEHLEPG